MEGEAPEDASLWPVREINVDGHLSAESDFEVRSGWGAETLAFAKALVVHEDYRNRVAHFPWVRRIELRERHYVGRDGQPSKAFNARVYYSAGVDIENENVGVMYFQWMPDVGICGVGGYLPE